MSEVVSAAVQKEVGAAMQEQVMRMSPEVRQEEERRKKQVRKREGERSRERERQRWRGGGREIHDTTSREWLPYAQF